MLFLKIFDNIWTLKSPLEILSAIKYSWTFDEIRQNDESAENLSYIKMSTKCSLISYLSAVRFELLASFSSSITWQIFICEF